MEMKYQLNRTQGFQLIDQKKSMNSFIPKSDDKESLAKINTLDTHR